MGSDQGNALQNRVVDPGRFADLIPFTAGIDNPAVRLDDHQVKAGKLKKADPVI